MTATAIISTVVVLAAWAYSHFVGGVGFAIDAVLLAIGFAMIGWGIFSAMRSMLKCLKMTHEAESIAELDKAAKQFDDALTQVGVDLLIGLLTRGAGKVRAKSSAKPKEAGAGAGGKTKAEVEAGKKAKADELVKPKPGVKPVIKSGALSKSEFDIKYSSGFSNKTEADAAWKVYNQTANTNKEIVIGRLPDTDAGGQLGMQYLNEPNWSPNVNDAWIQGGIDTGKPFYLGSNPKPENLYNPPGSLHPTTIFHREMTQLELAGYTQVGDYMIPPKKGP